uniref:Succinate dehydrogenase assembly factor 3 n=1 Tax=Steinernema glaseri TaxID=37863 RepID=A0A1I7YF24_9BILA
MGDQYVKEEFRRHRDATPQQALVFLNEWTQYCTMLAKQLSTSGIAKGVLGRQLSPEMLDGFADEQLHQLLELKMESEGLGEDGEQQKKQ